MRAVRCTYFQYSLAGFFTYQCCPTFISRNCRHPHRLLTYNVYRTSPSVSYSMSRSRLLKTCVLADRADLFRGFSMIFLVPT